MEVYLHIQGLFMSSEFAVLMPKKMFTLYKNLVLDLTLETMSSLSTADFSCSQEEGAATLDSCLLAEAIRTVNQSVGCLSKYLRWGFQPVIFMLPIKIVSSTSQPIFESYT